MDTSRARAERDPTMDARIVHSVSVSNKKEQSTLRHKERSLTSANHVQEHIHRREEKELVRQLTKLQDEKTRRHPDMLSPHSRSRTNSRLAGSHHGSNLILQIDHNSGHLPGVEPHHLAGGKSIHNASLGSGLRLHGPSTSHHRGSSIGLAAGISTHQAALIKRRQSSVGMAAVTDHTARGHLGLPGGLGLGLGGGSKHTSIGISPQVSSVVYDLMHQTPGPPPVHQPAGYGHSMKEYAVREGLVKKRPHHSYMDPKGFHGSQQMLARPGDSTGLLSSTGSRLGLNTAMTSQHHYDPRSSSHTFAGGGSHHRTGGSSMHLVRAAGPPPTSSHRMGVSSRILISRLFDGQSVLEVDETAEHQQKKERRKTDQRLQRSDSDHSSSASTDSKQEEVLKLEECHEDHDDENDDVNQQQLPRGSDTKVHFEDETEKAEKKPPDDGGQLETPRSRVGKSDHAVAARRGSFSTAEQERKKSARKPVQSGAQTSSKHTSPKSKKPTKKDYSKSAHVVKLSSEMQPTPNGSQQDESVAKTKRLATKKTKPKDATSNHIHIDADTLNEIRAALSSNIKGDGGIDELLTSATAGGMGMGPLPNAPNSSAYDPSSNSTQNRRWRARLRALQYINSQMEALKQQQAADPMSNFDPLEILRCRYLRLSKSNIDTLKEMCRDSGIEIELHPHMNIEDIGKYVFEKVPSKSGSSTSSSSGDIKQIIV